MQQLDTSLIDWSRAQFALTAIYHWLFVPLTIGLGVVMALMETMYVRTRRAFWKQTTKFWMIKEESTTKIIHSLLCLRQELIGDKGHMIACLTEE